MSHHKADVHLEAAFEEDICAHLAAHGWHYAEGDAQHYDRPRALFPADLIAWVQESQPKAWEALSKTHGPAAETVLLDRVRKQIDARGTLDVLRHGVEILGLKKPLQLAQFKPALGMNPELEARYQANRLRVVRQVHYSVHNENSLDLVLFLNGIGVATGELKTDFTQSVEDAVDQYRFDRDPKPKGQGSAEPLLSFPSGALVHFAISNSHVRMATRLQGPATVFLPFDQGDQGGSGNPVNPDGPPHGLPVGAGLGARELAGDPRAVPDRPARCQEADRKGHLPALPPARRHPQACRRRPRRGRRRQVSDPALGGLGQNQHHRLDGPLLRRPARRSRQQGLRLRAGDLGSHRA